MLFRGRYNWRSKDLIWKLQSRLGAPLYLDSGFFDEDMMSSCVCVFFLNLTKLFFNDYANNYSTVMQLYGFWKIRFEVLFCLFS